MACVVAKGRPPRCAQLRSSSWAPQMAALTAFLSRSIFLAEPQSMAGLLLGPCSQWSNKTAAHISQELPRKKERQASVKASSRLLACKAKSASRPAASCARIAASGCFSTKTCQNSLASGLALLLQMAGHASSRHKFFLSRTACASSPCKTVSRACKASSRG